MPPSEGETHWPPGPNGCCCPSSPKISLKSSSSFPGQFAVVIGFDSSGFLTPATRPSTAGAVYALLKKMSQHLPTATTPNLNFCSFNSRINNACVSPPPLHCPVWQIHNTGRRLSSLSLLPPAVTRCENSGFNFRESRPSVAPALTTSLRLPET